MERKVGYDPVTQMFCDTPHEPNLGKLRFLRWLGEKGALEHPVYDQPVEIVEQFAARDILDRAFSA